MSHQQAGLSQYRRAKKGGSGHSSGSVHKKRSVRYEKAGKSVAAPDCKRKRGFKFS